MNRGNDETNVNNAKEITPTAPPPVPKNNKPILEKPIEKKPILLTPDQELKRKESINSEGDAPSTEPQHPKIIKPKPSIDIKNVRIVKNIGFDSLPNQVYRSSMINGFELNLMVVGCSGLGKSTYVNSLFLTDIYSDKEFPPTIKRTKQTTEINSTTVMLSENNVNLRLTLIDTPGFGESVDNRECWKPIVDYIEARYDEHMMLQSRVERTSTEARPICAEKARDCRVHVCLYFLEPTGHRLKPLDLEFLRHIHTKVNVVPVIGKADCLMPDEITQFKSTIKKQLIKEDIKIYDFSEEAAMVSFGISPLDKNQDKNLRDIMNKRQRQPFAVVSSNVLVEKPGGGKARGRVYPWGVVEVDNMQHNDFAALRTLLVSSHLQDLWGTTDRLHYERYRADKMNSIAQQSQFAALENGRDPMAQMDDERRQFEQKIRKMEADMQALFDSKVSEKTKRYEDKLSQIEKSEQENLMEIDREVNDLELRRKEFEAERLAWEKANRVNNGNGNGSTHASVEDGLDQNGVSTKKKSKSKWLLK